MSQYVTDEDMQMELERMMEKCRWNVATGGG
jgi:hypothetical protein